MKIQEKITIKKHCLCFFIRKKFIESLIYEYYNPVLNSFESVKMSQTLYLKALGLFLSDRECCMCSLSFDIFSQGRFQIPLSIQIHRIDRHHRF